MIKSYNNHRLYAQNEEKQKFFAYYIMQIKNFLMKVILVSHIVP